MPTPFPLNAAQQGAISCSVFSTRLTRGDDSELFIGGSNPAHYKGDFELHLRDPEIPVWYLSGGQFSVDGQAVATNWSALLDSGTSAISGPNSAVGRIMNKVPGAVALPSSPSSGSRTYWTFPCDAELPRFSFSFGGGLEWLMQPESLTWWREGNNCTSTFVGGGDMPEDSGWLVGHLAFRNVYTRWDFGLLPGERPSISFAELA